MVSSTFNFFLSGTLGSITDQFTLRKPWTSTTFKRDGRGPELAWAHGAGSMPENYGEGQPLKSPTWSALACHAKW